MVIKDKKDANEYKNKKEIIEKVITTINDLYPPKTPRVDLSLPSFDMPSAEIIITLFEHENMPYTDFSLINGTSNSKQSVNIGNLLASNCLSLSALKTLTDYILINDNKKRITIDGTYQNVTHTLTNYSTSAEGIITASETNYKIVVKP